MTTASLLIVALVGLALASCRQDKGSPTPAGSELRLTVATYNVLADPVGEQKRIPALMQILGRAEADLIALQEVAPWFESRLDAEQWSTDFARCAKGRGHLPSGRQLILSRFPIEACATVPLPSRFGRTLVWARVATPNGPLTFATTHLDSPLKAGKMRQAQLRRIAIELTNSERVIVAGDFNFGDGAEPETSALPRRLTDAWLTIFPGRPGWTWDVVKSPLSRRMSYPDEPNRRLDRVLATQNLSPTAIAIVGNTAIRGEPMWFPSDHFGLVASFAWR